jgi:hypothetical protein
MFIRWWHRYQEPKQNEWHVLYNSLKNYCVGYWSVDRWTPTEPYFATLAEAEECLAFRNDCAQRAELEKQWTPVAVQKGNRK